MNITAQHKAQSILAFPCVARSILYGDDRAYLADAPCGALQPGLTAWPLYWSRTTEPEGAYIVAQHKGQSVASFVRMDVHFVYKRNLATRKFPCLFVSGLHCGMVNGDLHGQTQKGKSPAAACFPPLLSYFCPHETTDHWDNGRQRIR